jgi:hypothetical protein
MELVGKVMLIMGSKKWSLAPLIQVSSYGFPDLDGLIFTSRSNAFAIR